jgi:drug/metabolite transporter (DMT)-like permease
MAFAACGAIWGSTFLVISIGNDALAPVWAATLRLTLAALLLAAWTRARGRALPRGAALRAALGYGIAQFGLNLPLLYWGEKMVPSGLSAVVFATIPLTSAIMARLMGLERLTRAKVLGAVVAFGGVAVLFSSTLQAHAAPVGLAAIFVGATAASLGTVLLKRGPRQDPFGANAVGCAVGAPISAAISFGLGEAHALPLTFGAAWPVVYLAPPPLVGHAHRLRDGHRAGDRAGARRAGAPRTTGARPPRWRGAGARRAAHRHAPRARARRLTPFDRGRRDPGAGGGIQAQPYGSWPTASARSSR